MREIKAESIKNAVKEALIQINYHIGEDVKCAFQVAREKEESTLAKGVFDCLLENADIAMEKQIPLCQDTGMAVIFAQIGSETHVSDGFIGDAINQGVREAYLEGYLRKSVVENPLNRINTKDNTPAIIHYEMVLGDDITLTIGAKGFGSENMSKIKMLNPSDGKSGIIDFVLDTVKSAGSNPCPPMIVGVGIGGTMEKAALLAKKALMRHVGEHNQQDEIAKELELQLLPLINELGIGPQGFGGSTTALAANVEMFPTHIAGLPVAVNINCHASRHTTITFGEASKDEKGNGKGGKNR